MNDLIHLAGPALPFLPALIGAAATLGGSFLGGQPSSPNIPTKPPEAPRPPRQEEAKVELGRDAQGAARRRGSQGTRRLQTALSSSGRSSGLGIS